MKVIALITSSFVLVGTTGAYAMLKYYEGNLKRLDVFNQGHKSKSEGGAVNYLLVGTDSSEGLTRRQITEFRLGTRSGARSDTMMLLHVSKKRDRATLVSFPRDSY